MERPRRGSYLRSPNCLQIPGSTTPCPNVSSLLTPLHLYRSRLLNVHARSAELVGRQAPLRCEADRFTYTENLKFNVSIFNVQRSATAYSDPRPLLPSQMKCIPSTPAFAAFASVSCPGPPTTLVAYPYTHRHIVAFRPRLHLEAACALPPSQSASLSCAIREQRYCVREVGGCTLKYECKSALGPRACQLQEGLALTSRMHAAARGVLRTGLGLR